VDFGLTEAQTALRDLAEQIFAGHATVDRVKAVERDEGSFDRALWAELAKANLLGLAVPEPHGGSGLGLLELCLLLEQQGRRVAPVPLYATTVLGALPIAEWGTPAQQAEWLPAVVAGEAVLTAALAEPGANLMERPAVRAAAETGGGWRVTGHKPSVPAATVAARVLVPATTVEGDVAVFLVDPAGAGVTVEPAVTTNREVHGHLYLDGAGAELLGGGPPGSHGRGVVEWMRDRALVGLCALQLGVAEEAIRMAAAYSSQRVQFGRPLSTFQGAALKAADAYIDTEAIRATMLQAAWRLGEGLDATTAVRAAKWWAAEGGQRVVHTTQHLHGGLGADVDYPIHRYFLWGKQLEVMLGGASQQLAALGAELAAQAKAGTLRPVGVAP
jgi:acyl-CoA dehydrogenase